MHEVPSRPWEKVGADLFSFKGRQYLLTVDYYSQFFELDHLPETTSREVIYKLKHHFSRHGIPDTLISDNGPQFSSAEFKKFARTWSFKHDPISPCNSKANGAAEASVKIAKSTMMKCQRRPIPRLPQHEKHPNRRHNHEPSATSHWKAYQNTSSDHSYGVKTKLLLNFFFYITQILVI
ncbi:hypothetical protein RRG08_040478 [Elysia crispata]|uniref:Integrase catalytic domain-containing protein n=1 Tax=Elysia crispata TaxID=231223 RepID=A0AAE0YAZ3_9GAST|nr:hypothetical protein RRG08_040478 [Elysia crispata]